MRTLVIQSCPDDLPDGHWMHRCLGSVSDWSTACGYEYRRLGDAVLGRVPGWYREKTAERLPIQFDLVRLQLLEDALAENFDRACWVDADVLLFRPQLLHLDYPGDCAFGREHWVQPRRSSRGPPGGIAEGYVVRRNVHNAICSFDRGSPVLPFLRHATLRVIERADPSRIAPQMVGPKLLGALHSLVQFDLLDTVGALSPWVLDDVVAGHGPALEAQRGALQTPLAGANLCASLAGERDLNPVCDALLAGIS